MKQNAASPAFVSWRNGDSRAEIAREGLAALAAEHTSLRSLVHHSGWVPSHAPLEGVLKTFTDSGVDFLALVSEGTVSGVCSRLQLGTLLGSRFGFALYSRSPAHTAQVEHPLVFAETTPVREVLDRALARRGDEFHEDVVLVDAGHALLGLIPVDALARLQSKLVADQVAELRRQHLGLFTAQHALRQSHGLYLGLFENHALGVALLDGHGRVHEHNRRLAELLKVGPEEWARFSLADGMAESERADFLTLLHAQAGGGCAPVTREVTLAIAGVGARRFRCSLGWIRETGQICACFDDITEQRAIERHLLRQEKQTLLDTLVGGIAHELNNKLTPVQGFSELIALGADPQMRQFADLITRSVDEAAGIIRQLLQLSKPTPGAEAMQTIDLRTVADEALSMLRFEVREARCTVRRVFAAEPVWVRADPAQIKQVLINLALNALQATGRSARASLEVRVATEGRFSRVTVSDNGVGIPPENLGRIFDPFFTTKGPDRGTGLGLSVCFSIVRQHGGEISVESAPGAGASFTVSLPADAPALQALFLPEATEPETGARAETAPRGQRVLVVDDELVVRRLIQEVLVAQFGCEIDAVQSGLEALECLARTPYTLVISDIRMPDMNGTELFLWLREAQPAMARRFIFVTGHAGDQALEGEIAQWGAPVLAKPFTLAKLAEACAPYLRTSAGWEASA
jgi:signal transduction histidine kinase